MTSKWAAGAGDAAPGERYTSVDAADSAVGQGWSVRWKTDAIENAHARVAVYAAAGAVRAGVLSMDLSMNSVSRVPL